MDFLMTPISQDSSIKASSSVPNTTKGNFSSRVKDFLPANRSSLTLSKNQSLILNCSRDTICNEKNLLMPARKNMRNQAHEIIDLTGFSILDEQPSKEELLAPFHARKRKLLSTENVATQQIEVSHEHSSCAKKFETNGAPFSINSVQLENSPISNSISSQHAQVGTALLRKDNGTPQRREVEFLRQKNKDVQSINVPSGNEENRGSDFLIQVKEKLSAEEYKNFVEFLKALKSKTMQTSQALQSIVSLFSGPERLPLLKRFKDYIPAKHHSLYEHCVEVNGNRH